MLSTGVSLTTKKCITLHAAEHVCREGTCRWVFLCGAAFCSWALLLPLHVRRPVRNVDKESSEAPTDAGALLF